MIVNGDIAMLLLAKTAPAGAQLRLENAERDEIVSVSTTPFLTLFSIP